MPNRGSLLSGGESEVALKSVVVYQSLWGSSAAVARAIAEGLGDGTLALSTNDASAEILAGADLVVAGCPVHALGLPSEQSVAQAVAKPVGRDEVAADASHRLMRDWLAEMRPGSGRAAAFDTRVRGVLGHGGASKVLAGLEKAGYRRMAKPQGFYVPLRPVEVAEDGMLLPGERERALAWGDQLRALAVTA